MPLFSPETLASLKTKLGIITAAEDTNNKDASGGYAGLTLFKIDFKNAANTFTSFFTNSNTAARTYTFSDKDGTIILDADKDISGGVPGLTLFKINFKNTANTFTSFLVNAATAARTYTFPDKTGTIALADDKDISGGYTGLTAFKVNMYNVAGTFISFFTNTNTAARTYTLPDKDGTVAMLSDISGPAVSCVRLVTANGYGTTNTMIHRFVTAVVNTGTGITYADSAANGATFTINTTGTYTISSSYRSTGSVANGISLNSAELTTSILTIIASSKLAVVTDTSGSGSAVFCSATLPLTAGDVIRSHGNAVGDNATDETVFIITGPL